MLALALQARRTLRPAASYRENCISSTSPFCRERTDQRGRPASQIGRRAQWRHPTVSAMAPVEFSWRIRSEICPERALWRSFTGVRIGRQRGLNGDAFNTCARDSHRADVEFLVRRSARSRAGQRRGPSERAHLGTGRTDLFPGELPLATFVVIEGLVRVSGVNSNGRETILDFYGPGTWLGGVGVLSGTPRGRDADAVGDAVVLELSLHRRDLEGHHAKRHRCHAHRQADGP